MELGYLDNCMSKRASVWGWSHDVRWCSGDLPSFGKCRVLLCRINYIITQYMFACCSKNVDSIWSE